jgi:4-hydroxy-tetrahydrodipicolinate synthase
MPRLTAELIPAMVTPFREDGTVDYPRAEALANKLVDEGCDGILVNGTTGEGPTLLPDEKVELVNVVKTALAGRNVPLISGVGSNDTRRSAEEARKLARLGIDGLLVIVPYYNKPSQKGMIAHFNEVAMAAPDTEMVIYNIPSRCGVLMSADTMAILHAQCPNLVGVKQSHPDMDCVSEIRAKLPAETWTIWSGDDSLTLPMMACGAHGAISVLAHLTAPLLRRMIQTFKQGNVQEALQLHLKQHYLARELFFLPNPTVVKTCLAEMGTIQGTMRPPMIAPDADELKRIQHLVAEVKRLTADVPPMAVSG